MISPPESASGATDKKTFRYVNSSRPRCLSNQILPRLAIIHIFWLLGLSAVYAASDILYAGQFESLERHQVAGLWSTPGESGEIRYEFKSDGQLIESVIDYAQGTESNSSRAWEMRGSTLVIEPGGPREAHYHAGLVNGEKILLTGPTLGLKSRQLNRLAHSAGRPVSPWLIGRWDRRFRGEITFFGNGSYSLTEELSRNEERTETGTWNLLPNVLELTPDATGLAISYTFRASVYGFFGSSLLEDDVFGFARQEDRAASALTAFIGEYAGPGRTVTIHTDGSGEITLAGQTHSFEARVEQGRLVLLREPKPGESQFTARTEYQKIFNRLLRREGSVSSFFPIVLYQHAALPAPPRTTINGLWIRSKYTRTEPDGFEEPPDELFLEPDGDFLSLATFARFETYSQGSWQTTGTRLVQRGDCGAAVVSEWTLKKNQLILENLQTNIVATYQTIPATDYYFQHTLNTRLGAQSEQNQIWRESLALASRSPGPSPVIAGSSDPNPNAGFANAMVMASLESYSWTAPWEYYRRISTGTLVRVDAITLASDPQLQNDLDRGSGPYRNRAILVLLPNGRYTYQLETYSPPLQLNPRVVPRKTVIWGRYQVRDGSGDADGHLEVEGLTAIFGNVLGGRRRVVINDQLCLDNQNWLNSAAN